MAPDCIGLLVEFKMNEANPIEVATTISLVAKLKAKKKRPERRVSGVTCNQQGYPVLNQVGDV